MTLVIGGLITYFAWQAYRQTNQPPLRSLAIGFGVITTGALVSGAVDLLTTTATLNAVALNSALMAVGFAIILRSLYSD
ncbi:MAG: hypothetical protein ABEJ79_01580 [Halolamina sp.]